VLFYKSIAYFVDRAFFNPFAQSQGILAEKWGLNLQPSFVNKHHIEQFCKFALFAVELFVRRIQDSHQDLPILKIDVQIANFFELLHILFSDFLQLLFFWELYLDHSIVRLTVNKVVTIAPDHFLVTLHLLA